MRFRLARGFRWRSLSLTVASAAVLTTFVIGRARLSVAALDERRSGGDPQSGVYVRDSAIAADKFELGKRMERLKEWHKSADVYQEILEKYRDRVVPVAFDDRQQPIKYASVTVAVQERLARWPDEGLLVYRTRFEPAAAALLEQAGREDLATLHRIFDQYFATDAAKQAAIRLMDLYMESGDFTAAAWIGDRLLQLHPSLLVERPGVLFRVALASHLMGNKTQADARFEELKARHAGEIGTVAGADVNLVEALAQQLEKAPPAATGGSANDAWLTFGGDGSRSLVNTAAATAGARVYSIDLPGPNLPNLSDPGKQVARTAFEEARSQGLTTNIMPVIDRGELFFQDGDRVYAVHVESGVPLAGWQQAYPTRDGRYLLAKPIAPAGAMGDQWIATQLRTAYQHTVTLTDTSVLAIMGQGNLVPMRGASASGTTRLVCLDRATGRQRWTADPNNLPSNPGNARNLSFSGSPLVVGDNVYVIARGTGAGVEECHVFCYDLQSGAHRWSCYIASSQSGAMNMGNLPASSSSSTSHLAFASGRVFVLTNVGAVAAIDAYSGATAWLSVYPRSSEAIEARRRAAMMGGWWGGGPPPNNQDNIKPWEFNPVIVQDGKVFALPLDGDYLHVYDAGTGEETKRIGREITYRDITTKLTMLLAVVGEKIVLAGHDTSGNSNDHVYCLNWSVYGQKKPGDKHLDVDATVWWAPTDTIRGRPFVTQNNVFVPQKNAMAVLDMRTGQATDKKYPRGDAPWPGEEGPGNVIVTRDHVIIANARNISIYTDLAGVRQKYEMAIKADPENVTARLIYSELMFNAGDRDESLRVMDEAIQVLGGLKAMRPGASRDRLFADAVLFAQRLAKEKGHAANTLADKLFERAAAAAMTPMQQVNYRLSRARFIEGLKDGGNRPDDAMVVRLYQEILSAADLRTVALAREDGGLTQAGRVAEDAITNLIRQLGEGCYERYRKEAAEQLKSLAGGKPDQLLDLAEVYPNAVSVATAAMMQAADAYEKSNQPRMATQVLRRLYWKYSTRFNRDEKTSVVEAMARNGLKAGNVSAALGHVRRISALTPQTRLAGALTGPDGKPLQTADNRPVQTFNEAAEAMERLDAQNLTESLPGLKLPPVPSAEERLSGKPWPIAFSYDESLAIPGVQALLKAPDGQGRHDRLIAWRENRVSCFAPGKTEPLWTSAALGEGSPLGLYWLGERLLVWSDVETAMLDGEKGEVVWKGAIRSLPAVELLPAAGLADGPVSEPAGVPDAVVEDGGVAQALVLERQAILAGRGGAAAADAADQAVDDRERILHVRRLSDRVVLSTSAGRVLALDLASGHTLWQTRLANSRAIQQTLSTDDFTVIRLSEGFGVQLVVLDSYNGQQIHRRSFMSRQQSEWPINAALSPDGMLVWTTSQAMAAKDLYEPGDKPTWARPEQPNAATQWYAGMALPDQLLIYRQQVLAVNQGGRFVERRRLRSGEPIGNPIGIGGGNATVRLQLTGARMYIVGDRALVAYHLEAQTMCPIMNRDAGNRKPNERVTLLPANLLLTRDYAMLPDMIETIDQNKVTYMLQICSRALIRSGDSRELCESGLQVHSHGIQDPSRVKDWQAIDGGLYYLAGDGKLHWLKGNER